ncbi:MAG: hypothetical protein ACD_4C00392G0002 [uncultured bacterium (gcode 4)]|uniref:Uncharacterized protein n=1 Tax=uncultured bacterium (gcode 4) TaxID=1234023 RepID=K2G810_9BACT|nr:MAG: hypothetical protein ACD_4C00392G0002 [uncultured bacterium (gcode 4)]
MIEDLLVKLLIKLRYHPFLKNQLVYKVLNKISSFTSTLWTVPCSLIFFLYISNAIRNLTKKYKSESLTEPVQV